MNNNTNNPALINVDEVKQELEKGTDAIILDVRTQEEYNSGHIKGSLLITLDDLQDKVEEEIPNKDAKIYVYCRSGGRSSMAQMTLQSMGYTNCKNIIGGILEWEDRGYPLES